MLRLRSAPILASLFLFQIVQAEPIKRAMHPGISPDGKQLVFSYQNDLWITNSGGGEARRLTVHPATDYMPRWFPDGSRIAFSSNRYGNYDVFTIKPDGSDLKRLNHDPSNENVYSISPDGKLIFGYTNAWGRMNLYCLSAEGGDAVRMTGHPLELQYFPTPSPDGKRIAYCISGSPGSWRNPKESGSDSGEIWIGNLGLPLSANKKLTNNTNNDTFPLFASTGEIAFFSNRSGTPQLWKMNSEGGAAKQLTKHSGGTLRWPTISRTGIVAYEYDSEIWMTTIADGKTSKVSISLPDDKLVNPTQRITATSGISDFVVSPDGKRGAIAVRGDIFMIPSRGGTTRRLTTNLAIEKDPVWISNDKVLFVTGRNAKRELRTVDINGIEAPFASDALDLTNPILSPDGKTVAMHRGDREIAILPVAGGAGLKTIATGSFPGAYADGPSFSWSPDSAWIAFEDSTERGSTIRLTEIATQKSLAVARVARGAGRPQFSPNGKTVVFDSFELADGGIQAVDLTVPELTFSEDDLDKIDEAKPKESGSVKVEIDLNGIDRRKRTLIADASLVGVSPDSRSVWSNLQGQLVSSPLSGGPSTPVASVTGFVSKVQLEGAGKAHLVAAGRAFTLNLQSGTAAPVNFNAQYNVDRKAEELELFKEIWWAMDRMYYDPKLHGLNWNAIKQEYQALVPYCFDRADFYALMTEMIEELDSSHLSISSPPGDIRLESESFGWIGVEWNWAKVAFENKFEVASVLRGSPAYHPMSRLQKGDAILAVDGQSLGANLSFSEAMKYKLDRKTRLTVLRGGKEVAINIRPASSALATPLIYEDFVEARRAEVDRLSNGRFTYFHIQGMNQPSTDRFFRDARNLGEGKQGAIVDVRWNGGGNTANRILAALRTEKWLERKFRSRPGAPMSEEMFRGEAIEMPVVIMTNQYSASNAEIFSEGFRRMKIGKVVGEPTGGNVLTVAGQYGLWDGGGVQIPFIGIYTVDGESLEGIGRRVDVDVRFDPNAWNQGRDNQLEAAVAELKKASKR